MCLLKNDLWTFLCIAMLTWYENNSGLKPDQIYIQGGDTLISHLGRQC